MVLVNIKQHFCKKSLTQTSSDIMEFEDIMYLCLFFASISFGCYYRTIRDKNLKKNVGTCVGFVLTIIVSGVHCLHLLVLVSINAAIILKIKKKIHLVSFIFSFLYLTFSRSTTYFGIPYPPGYIDMILMIFVLKLVGLSREIGSPEKKIEDKGTNQMKKIAFVDIFHYCFNYIGILTGPYYTYRTFIDYFNYPFAEHARWRRVALQKFKFVPLYVVIGLGITSIWPPSYVTTDEFYQRPGLYRYWYMWPMLVVFHARLFIAFHLQTLICVTAGFGAYPSFTNPQPGRGPSEKFSEMEQLLSNEGKLSITGYSFETINSVNVLELECSLTIRDLVKNWNCCVQYWLVANIYRTIPYKKHRRAATILVSTVWHGTYLGYYISLGLLPFLLMVEDIYIELYLNTAKGRSLKIWEWIHRFYKFQCFAYMIVAFTLLRVDLALRYYNSVYHFGAVIEIILYAVGMQLLKRKMTTEKKIPARST